jgi:hypothetical protein
VSSDGGLRPLMREHLADGDWVAVETGATAGGVPDSNFCFSPGVEGWVEHKKTSGWKVKFRPAQVGWISRRVRKGGRVFVAVRRTNGASDQLYLVEGRHVEALADGGLRAVPHVGMWDGGPAAWDWGRVRQVFTSRPIQE